jgi:hypothetical protein
MPLLKPPEPAVAKRKYYVRLDEPLAATMERYAEFIGAHTADHVISQALEFVFKKDSDFREWLDKNPIRGSQPGLRKANRIRHGETLKAADTSERQEAV